MNVSSFAQSSAGCSKSVNAWAAWEASSDDDAVGQHRARERRSDRRDVQPGQHHLHRRNRWDIHPTNGQVLPTVAFTTSLPATLDVTLIFDGTEDGRNVAKIVDQLASLHPGQRQVQQRVRWWWRSHRLPVEAAPAADRAVPVGQLPLVQGDHRHPDHHVHAVPRRRDAGPGVRRRALQADRGRRRSSRSRTRPPAAEPASASTASGRGRRSTRSPTPAFGQTGLWRALAAFNGIDDPLRLQAGDAILLPASVDDLKALA